MSRDTKHFQNLRIPDPEAEGVAKSFPVEYKTDYSGRLYNFITKAECFEMEVTS